MGNISKRNVKSIYYIFGCKVVIKKHPLGLGYDGTVYNPNNLVRYVTAGYPLSEIDHIKHICKSAAEGYARGE